MKIMSEEVHHESTLVPALNQEILAGRTGKVQVCLKSRCLKQVPPITSKEVNRHVYDATN